MVTGYSHTLEDTTIEEAIQASANIDGGDLNAVSPAMDYLDLSLLDGGAL